MQVANKPNESKGVNFFIDFFFNSAYLPSLFAIRVNYFPTTNFPP